MIAYSGTSASETLNSSNWNYNWNAFYMGAGDDTVVTPGTGVAYQFRGGYGNDHFVGDNAGDTAYGDWGNDSLYGWGGNDFIDGNDGNDTLYGNSGNDNVSGGAGRDHIYGGTGRDDLFGGYNDGFADYFHFAKGDSASTRAGADVIYDWDVRYDYIDSALAGAAGNYGEMSTTANNIETARSVVEGSGLRNGDHAFLYNAATDTGYLLSDLDRNYSFETGVVIKGAGAAADMNWSDII